MNSKIKVDKFVIVAFLLCMVCTMAMQAKAYDNFKVSVHVRAYEVDKMKDIHWLDSTWNCDFTTVGSGQDLFGNTS